MSDDKPQIGKIEFSPDYESPTTAHPFVVSLSGQNELGTTLRAYEKRIAELESALRGLLEAGYRAGLHDAHCHFCRVGADYLENITHEPDCPYIKAQQLLGVDDE